MAVVQGTRFSFTDSANNAIDMSDTLAMISPSDVPLLSIIGKDSLQTPCVATKHEWLEDTLRPLDTAVSGSGINNTTDPVTFNVTAGQGVYIAVGDILKIESELVRVTGVATDAITVARAFGGSTAAAHVDTTAVAIVGQVHLQNAAVGTARTTTKVGQFNYTQIYNGSVEATSTQTSTEKYVGPTDELSRLLSNELRVAWMTYERQLLHGRKVAPSSGVASAMDGILVKLTSNAYAKAGASLTEEFILQALQDTWTRGGRPSHLFVGAFQKRRINQFLDSQRMTSRTDREAGVRVDRYESDFGELTIVLDRNMPTDTLLGLEVGRVGFGPLRNHALRAAKIAQTTLLNEVWQIVGQYTAEVRNEDAHFKITGLATS